MRLLLLVRSQFEPDIMVACSQFREASEALSNVFSCFIGLGELGRKLDRLVGRIVALEF
jgi:hypothetical protein